MWYLTKSRSFIISKPVSYAYIEYFDLYYTTKKFSSQTNISVDYKIDIFSFVNKEGTTIYKALELSQIYPNLFNSIIAIKNELNGNGYQT